MSIVRGTNPRKRMDDMISRSTRQAQIIRDIALEIGDSIPIGWERARYTVTASCSVLDFAVKAYSGGEEKSLHASHRAAVLADELRSVMYEPGAGAWFIFILDIASGGQANSTFDYGAEPVALLLDPEVYVDEQEKFPRDLEHQPGWYRERLAEGERFRAERDAASEQLSGGVSMNEEAPPRDS